MNEKATMNEKVSEKIQELFSIDNLRPIPEGLDGDMKTDRVLYLLMLSLCLVSFFATAEGLSANVFIHNPERAFVVSLVVQAIIFFFAVSVGKGKSDKAKESAKAGGTANKAAVLVYIGALIISVVFDFVFICNSAYDLNSEGVQGNDVYLSSNYNTLLSNAERYASDVTEELEGDLRDQLDRIKVFSGNEDTITVDAQSYDGDVKAHASNLNGLIGRHASTDELDEYIAGLSNLCDQLDARIAEQNELTDRYRELAYSNWAYGGGDSADAVVSMDGTIEEASRLSNTREQYRSLIGQAEAAKASGGYQAVSNYETLVAQLKSIDPNPQVISESLHDIITIVTSSDGDETEQVNLIHTLNDIAERYDRVGELKYGLEDCRGYLKAMLASGDTEEDDQGAGDGEVGESDEGNGGGETDSDSDEGQETGEQASPDSDIDDGGTEPTQEGQDAGADQPAAEGAAGSGDNPDGLDQSSASSSAGSKARSSSSASTETLASRFGSGFDKQEWAERWTGALSLLRLALDEAPASKEDEARQEINGYIDRVNELEHDRLGYISNFEQAFQYLCPRVYPYPFLAWLCLVIALFLDLGSLGIGFYMRNHR